MKTFKKYPSTIQFSGAVKHVRDHCKYHNLPLPTLKMRGSIKLHGTNAAVGFSDGDLWFQSRENIITYEKDNAGFATWGEQNANTWKKIYDIVTSTELLDHDAFYIYGEWFGASIQKGVALSQIPEKKFGIFKMVFVNFRTKVIKRMLDGVEIEEEVDADEHFEIDPCNYHEQINAMLPNVVVIDYIVPPVEVMIDFAAPDKVQNKLLEMVLAIEAECPVGKYFGVSGIGEGVVFSCDEVDWLPKFKCKGELHSASKVKTVRELTEAEIASKENASEFVEYACTENRLQQGIDKLGEMGLDVDIKSMGAYLKWLVNDCITEEKEVLLKSGIDKKDVCPRLSDKGRQWFLNYLNAEMGIAA